MSGAKRYSFEIGGQDQCPDILRVENPQGGWVLASDFDRAEAALKTIHEFDKFPETHHKDASKCAVCVARAYFEERDDEMAKVDKDITYEEHVKIEQMKAEGKDQW